MIFAICAAFLAGGIAPFVPGLGIPVAFAESKPKAKPKGGGHEKKGEGEEGAAHPEFEYLDMKPLVLPVITESGLTQQVSLMVSLEVPYGKMEEVTTLEPRLADAFLQDLYGALGAGGISMKSGIIDVVAIKQRLTDVADKVMGKERVHGVLLQVLQQKPM